MTDPSTLFLSAPQVRPSWTLNGLTLELNLAPAHVSNNDLQTAVGDSVFAVTQSASFLSTSSLNGGVPAVSNASTVTNALLPSNPVVEQNVSQMNNCAGFYVSSVTTGTIEDALKKPVFLASSAGQQVSENATEKKKRQKVIAEGSSNADDECTPVAETKSSEQAATPKKIAVGTPCQVAEITTSVVNEVRDNSSVAGTTQATTIVSAAPITTTSVIASLPASKIATSSVPITANAGALASNNGIPVGIAVARQRYVSSTTCKSQTQNLKETINTSSTSSPYTSSVPYQPLIESPSLFPPAISNIVSGVVAGTTGCDDRSIANIGGNILPSIIAWPQQQQQQPHAIQPWYPYAGTMETVTPNVSPACATGYQLVRDPVGGHIILIPSNQIGSTQSTATANFATTTNQQLQSFLIPQHFQQQQQQQQHSQSHSLFLDHLVSVVPSSTNIKQNSVSTLLKLHDGVLTGVMMPCDLGKPSSVVNPTQTTATIGQQLLSANNSSISLVHQFNSSNIHNPNMNAPHHFSSISSSGSLLIQQISGNAGQSPLMNHHHHINNSVVIAESTAMQSVINTQPTYPANNAPYLINTPVSTTENSSSAAVNHQLQPAAAACIVSNSSQQTATYGQLPPPSINELVKPTIVQSKIVNIEKQVNIETKLTDAIDQSWPSQSTAQILVEKTEENAVIKIDTNSIVQDASNQTEDNDDKEEDVDDDEYASAEVNDKCGDGVDAEGESSLRSENANDVDSLSDKMDSSRKSKPKRDKTATNEEIMYDDRNPDFMGLQLLLSSIERVEHSVNATTNVEEDTVKEDTTDDSDKDTDKPTPNGLEILCALVDQRIKEEKNSESDELSADDDDFRNTKTPPLKGSKIHHSHKHDLSQSSEITKSQTDNRRFLTSKYKQHRLPPLPVCDTDPLQMRMELAKLQKKYRETRKELNRLTYHRKRGRSSSRTRSPSPDDVHPLCDIKSDVDAKTVKRKPGRPRKFSDPLDAKRAKCVDTDLPAKSTIRPMKRPKLKLDTTRPYADGCADDEKVPSENNGDLSPPVLEPMCTPPKSKSFKSEVLSPPTLVANKVLCVGPKGLLPDVNERLWPSEFEKKPLYHRLSSDDLSDEDSFKREDTFKRKEASEPITTLKRKVGRPRKYPKEGVPPSIEPSRILKPSVHNKKNALTSHKSNEKQIPVTSSVVSTFAMLKSQRASIDTNLNTRIEHKPKITPKLKAEAKLKTWRQKSPEICRDALDLDFEPKPKKRKIDPHDRLLERSDRNSYSFGKSDKQCHLQKKHFPPSDSNSSVGNSSKLTNHSQTIASTSAKSSSSSSSLSSSSSSSTSSTARAVKPSLPPTEYTDEDFKITPKLLDESEKQPLRVLLPVGNLFRAGELSAVSPPDLYGIKLDGDRRKEGHIYSKEDVLREAVLEVRGKNPLRIGTRVCAFWSSQYHSLYPGTVTSFSSLDEPEDENYTAVEFDDGDSGRIKMSKIRVLPQNIAIRKSDGDESEALGKRKRRISSVSFDEIPVDKQLHSPDRLSSHRHKIGTPNAPSSSSTGEPSVQSLDSANSDAEKPASSDSMDKKKNSERKKLKKKHKDKMRDSSDPSCKRKSHKHRSDTDDGSVKKRHKHKHKHHKHHKRKRSHDTDRCESDSHYKCSSKSHGKGNKVDKLLDEDLDWTSVPPYSSHLTEAKKSETSPSKTSSPKAKEKPESTLSILDSSAKNSSNQSKVNEEEVNDEQKSSKKSGEDATGEPEKVEIKRIRHRKSVDYSASKDNETNVVDDAKEKETNSSVDAASPVTEQQDSSSPSEETDASTSSRRGSDSTSDSESSSGDKFWDWHGKGSKRNGKGRGRKEFYKSIKRGDVIINVGDCAVFLTAGNSAKPFIGKIEAMWESYGNMMVRVKWFYHPEETTGLTKELPYLGALFESPHNDRNDVQTISHKCDVISLSAYRERLEKEPERIHNVYESNDLYYLAGYYDPTTKRLQFEEDVSPEERN